MQQSSVIVIGAGIVGAALVWRLARGGHAVTVLDAGAPGGVATRASFGWINASFHHNHAHFALRAEGLAAWRRLEVEAGPLPLRWPGALWWEEEGAAFDEFATRLADLGYPAERLTDAALRQYAPAVAPPERTVLHLPSEGVADAGRMAQALLAGAARLGARVLGGVTVRRVETGDGAVTGVETDNGRIAADTVIVATGTTAPVLCEPLGLALPMLRRPGVLLRTQPVDIRLDPVMVAPGQEFCQLPDGRLLAPTSPKHQGDSAEVIAEPLPELAEATLERLAALLPGVTPRAETVLMGLRPVPADGLPVVGQAGPDGLWLTVMHSGVTLAAVVAEAVSAGMAGDASPWAAGGLLAPFGPERFAV